MYPIMLVGHRISCNSHDLLPFPYNQDNLDYVARRVQAVQDYLGKPYC